jgi:hypothetical protein
MNTSVDYGEPLDIGTSGEECWDTMHRPGQRVLYFVVSFEELDSSPDKRDYRVCLSHLWSGFLNESGLSASIMHHGWHPERGPIRSVVGWVWRQNGGDTLGDLSESELFRLSDLLQEPQTKVTHFGLTEQFTTSKRGKNVDQRKLRLGKSGYVIEPPPIHAPMDATPPTTNIEA